MTTGTLTKMTSPHPEIGSPPLTTIKTAPNASRMKRKSAILSSPHPVLKREKKYFRSKAPPKTESPTTKTSPECTSFMTTTLYKKNKTEARARHHI